jgi:uncharacterized protein involved in exopolysaccharide biosynthesis
LNARAPKLLVTGAVLVASGLLIFGVALLHVSFAPRTYAAQAKLLIQPGLTAPALLKLDNLLREFSRLDHDLRIDKPRSGSVFGITAFALTPEAAATRANQRGRELQEKVRAQTKVQVVLIAEAQPNPRAVRPNTKAILAVSGAAALNLAIVGVFCLLIGFLKGRALLTSPGISSQTLA